MNLMSGELNIHVERKFLNNFNMETPPQPNDSSEDVEASSQEDEHDAHESFVDVSSPGILQTLSDAERELVREHRELFDRLNEAKNSSERSNIFDEQRELQGFPPQGSEQRKVYDLVVRLKEEYS